MKRPLLGPPERPAMIVRALTTVDNSPDPVDVVAAALALRDMRPIPPTGGGMAIAGRAREYAEDVIAALARRGMLERQGRLL